ncbi:hypothetical protein DFJ74DRAFT_687508 [Hyaloraphidium curvatum]|nr:hypothetical protein DFJ74DRAFT_687508 [Hyaloraphidium curvatum]
MRPAARSGAGRADPVFSAVHRGPSPKDPRRDVRDPLRRSTCWLRGKEATPFEWAVLPGERRAGARKDTSTHAKISKPRTRKDGDQDSRPRRRSRGAGRHRLGPVQHHRAPERQAHGLLDRQRHPGREPVGLAGQQPVDPEAGQPVHRGRRGAVDQQHVRPERRRVLQQHPAPRRPLRGLRPGHRVPDRQAERAPGR